MFLKIYATIWGLLTILGLAIIALQLDSPFYDKKALKAQLIGFVVTIPIYVCAFLYIFK